MRLDRRQMANFEETLRLNHEVLGTSNACWILTCGRETKIALRGKQSEVTHFYCLLCAHHLMLTFPNLFEEVKNG